MGHVLLIVLYVIGSVRLTADQSYLMAVRNQYVIVVMSPLVQQQRPSVLECVLEEKFQIFRRAVYFRIAHVQLTQSIVSIPTHRDVVIQVFVEIKNNVFVRRETVRLRVVNVI